MVPETIMGLTSDPTLMPVAVTITAIQQDEPVNALGSGNTVPDGMIVNTSTGSTAYVRAERAGSGTGRIYWITFTAMDQSGNTCGPITQARCRTQRRPRFRGLPKEVWRFAVRRR
jgi:hypothetical protein